MKWLLPIVLLLIFASGCIELPFNPFGKDVVDVNTNIINEGPSDILIIKEPESIPHSPMLPEQNFLFSFILENRDDLKTAESVTVDLYNAPLIKDGSDDPELKGKSCNLYDSQKTYCAPRETSCTQQCEGGVCTASKCEETCSKLHTCEILPGEEQAINFDLLTPTQEEIVNIMTKVTLNYMVRYNTNGSLLYIVPVINKDEIIQRQRAGEKTTLTISKSLGSGPIKIDVELYGAPYIVAGESATFLFKLQNKGQGTLEKDNSISPGNMIIYFPAVFTQGSITGNFKYPKTWKCGQDDENPDVYIKCTNNESVVLYKDESRGSIRFEVDKAPKISEPFKSYEIHAFVKYNYELRGSYDISVNPFQNV